MGMAKLKEKSIFNLSKILNFILIVIIVLFVGTVVFFIFRLNSNAKTALRDAKNVLLAIYTTDIEMYGENSCVYDPLSRDGLQDGVEESVARLMSPPGDYSITAYSYKKHEVTGLEYRWGRYIVTYSKKGENIKWDVDYLLNVYKYDENNVKLDD